MDPEQLREFEENIRRINEMLSEQSTLQAGLLKGMKDQLNAVNLGTTASKVNTAAVDKQTGSTAAMTKLEEAERIAKEQQIQSTQNYSDALGNSQKALMSFAAAMVSGEKGFTKYGDAISKAGDAAQDLNKDSGLIRKVFGFLINAGSKLAAEHLKLTDAQLKFKDQFSKLGQFSNGTTDQLAKLANQAGYSYLDLEKLSKPLQTAGSALTMMNNAGQSGSQTFLKMADVGKETRMRFERLGISQEELTGIQAEYVALQRSSGIMLKDQAKDALKLKNASLEYADKLVTLSSLTGKSVDQVKEEQKAAMMAFEENMRRYQDQAKIAQLDKQIKEATDLNLKAELTRQRDAIVTEKNNREKFLTEAAGAINSTVANQFSKVAAAPGGAFGAGTEELARIGMDAGRIYEAVTSGSQEKIDELIQEYLDKTARMADKLGPAATMNERVAGQYGLTNRNMQSTEVLRAVMAETGKTYAEVKELAAERKKEQEKNRDKEGNVIDKDLEARGNLTEAEITAKTTFNKLIDSIDITDWGFDRLVIAIDETIKKLGGWADDLRKGLTGLFPKMFQKTANALGNLPGQKYIQPGLAGFIDKMTGLDTAGSEADAAANDEHTAKKNAALKGTGYTALSNMKYRAPDGSTVSAKDLPESVKRQLGAARIPGFASWFPGAEGAAATSSTKPDNVVLGPKAILSGVKPDLVSKFYAAAKEYGKPVTINSGFRDDKYQAEIFVRGSVYGEQGIYTPARPKDDQTVTVHGKQHFVKGSGKGSPHLGRAIDITPDGRDYGTFDLYLNKYGLHRPYSAKDPPHVELKARKGGVFSGPDSGYNVEMHGTEIVAPLQKNSILMELAKTSSRGGGKVDPTPALMSVLEEKTGSGAVDTAANAAEKIVIMNTELMQVLANKLDKVIDTMSQGNDTNNKLLKRTSV